MTKKHASFAVWQRRLVALIMGSAMICVLSACGAVMMASGAVSGSMAATDRRTLGSQTEDKVIVLKGESAVSNVIDENGHVNVTSFNRKVLLTGEVPSEAVKQAVGNAASQIENVEAVVNELQIAAPSSLASRSNDALITSKVSTSFLAEGDMYSQAFKTVTENGTVYLMGRVTEQEGDKATRVAGGVDGVQRVVKVFEYISEEELQRLLTLSAPSSSNQDNTTTDPDNPDQTNGVAVIPGYVNGQQCGQPCVQQCGQTCVPQCGQACVPQCAQPQPTAAQE